MANLSDQMLSPRAAERLDKEDKALDLRAAGMSYRAIGRAMETSEAQAHRFVKAALQRVEPILEAKATELRALECRRLDALQRALTPAASKGDVKAARAIVEVMKRRASLLGLDAPQKLAQTDTEGNDLTMPSVTFRLVDTNEPQKHDNPAHAEAVQDSPESES